MVGMPYSRHNPDQCQSVSGSQSLRPLSPGARAASPRKKSSMCCGKCAKRIFHNTYYFRRAPQARANDRDGNQTRSQTLLFTPGRTLDERELAEPRNLMRDEPFLTHLMKI